MFQNRSTKKSFKNDPFLRQFFARIPTETADSFSSEQLTELKRVFNNRLLKRDTVDIRFSIPFFGKRFYLVFMLGKENRSNRPE